MKINALEQKKLVIIFINYLFGAITGIVLFYAQLRGSSAPLSENAVFSPSLNLEGLLKTVWTNMLWIFSVFLFHTITPCVFTQPIMAVRGTVDSFCVMYILSSLGIKAAVTSALPQCFSILPVLTVFTLSMQKRRKNAVLTGREPCTIRRRDAASFFAISVLTACAEAAFFKLICAVLF